MEKDKERLQVIENIRKAAENKEFNSKVELHDHIVTEEEREKVILKYDSRHYRLDSHHFQRCRYAREASWRS